MDNRTILHLHDTKTSTELHNIIETNYNTSINKSSLYSSIKALNNKHKYLRKSANRPGVEQLMSTFLSQQYTLPTVTGKSISTTHAATADILEDTLPLHNITRSHSATLNPPASTSLVETGNKTDLIKPNKRLKKKVKQFNIKRTNEKLRRKDIRIKKRDKKIKQLKLELKRDCSDDKRQMREIKKQKTETMRYYKAKIATIEQRTNSPENCLYCRESIENAELVAILKQRVAELESANSQLKEELKSISCGVVVSTKNNKKTYSPEVRKAIYHCISSQVPVEKVGELINSIIHEITGRQLEQVPSRSTVCRIAREMSVISSLQVGEALQSSEAATLSWDATTFDGTHINEVHVTTSNAGSLAMGISPMPGGRCEDYIQDLTNVISDVASSYAGAHNLDPGSILAKTQVETFFYPIYAHHRPIFL